MLYEKLVDLIFDDGKNRKVVKIAAVAFFSWTCGHFILPSRFIDQNATPVQKEILKIFPGLVIFVIGGFALLILWGILSKVFSEILNWILTEIEKKFFGFSDFEHTGMPASSGRVRPGMSIRQMGEALQSEDARNCLNQISFYKTRFFKSRGQFWAYFLGLKIIYFFKLRKKARKMILRHEKFLEIIREYKPLIQAKNYEWQDNFSRWEFDNKRGWADPYIINLEKAAKNESYRLNQEAYEKLQKSGYNFLFIHPSRLVVSRVGWLSTENASRYWDDLENFFQAIITDLFKTGG